MPKLSASALAMAPHRQLTVREAQKNETRRRIFEAACALMARTNFLVTTIDMIASAAGVGRATFYLHFQSKHDIVDEANRIVQARLEALCEKLAAWERPDELAVIGWTRLLLEAHEEERIYLQVLWQFHSLDPERSFGGERWHTLIIDSLAPRNKAFSLVRERRPEHRMMAARAHMIFFAMERFIMCTVLDGGVSDREASIVLLGKDLHGFMNSV